MKNLIAAVIVTLAALLGPAAMAQQTVWVQIEAHPNLRAAEESARVFGGVFDDVSGFRMTTGWYAIVLGPHSADVAAARLADLRRERLIPADSYINTGANLRQRFWPVGAGALRPPAPEAPAQPDATVAAPAPAPGRPDEAPAEARRSEALLDQDTREALQVAMQWKGFYAAAIDGAFGPGTRAAMAAWQAANGHEPSGVLTTAQRAELLDAYRSELAALGLETLRDEATGIEIRIPGAMVAFSRYEPPFAHFDPVGDSGVRVLLISQTGTQATLAGLYEVMQTLEIIPVNGFRELGANAFTLTGAGPTRRAHARAELRGGLIKGYLLTWPVARDDQMGRVLEAMQASFTPFGDFALSPEEGGASVVQRRDLLAGLEIRRPELSRSGFFIDGRGAVLTTSQVVAGCERLTIDTDTEMTLDLVDEALGLALLRPRGPLSPIDHARLRNASPRLNSDIAVAGFSFEDALSTPVLTFGALADLRGLEGEETKRRLALSVLPGDAGGPVLDTSGAVLGMLLPREQGGNRQLPADVNFATHAQAIAALLADNGIAASRSEGNGALAAEDLTRRAADITVLVSCWN